MSARRWMNATTALRLAIASALLLSCTSDTGSGSAERTARTAGALNLSPTIGNFVLYAERSINLGDFDQTSGGDIGIAATAVSTFGSQLLVGAHVQVDPANNLLSPSTTLGSKAQVGDVQTTTLLNNGATTIGTVAAYPATLMPPMPVAGNPGSSTSPVVIGSHQNVTLSPGVYGALSVADHCNVTLAAGTYAFASVSISDHVQIASDPGGVTLLVSGVLATTGWDQIAPSGGATADKLVLLVGGADGVGGSPPAASIALHSQLTGLVAAPHGTLAVADHVQATGALAGYDVTLGDHTQVTFQAGFSPSTTPAQHGTQLLSGYVTPAMTAAPVVGPLPPNATIDFAIGLFLSDPQGLKTFIQEVSDPKNAKYGHYVTGPSDFAQHFGPSSADYNLLQMFADGARLTTEDKFPNNQLLHVYAPAAIVEQAFYTSFSLRLRPDGTEFYAIDVEPSLDFATPILRVSGFDNYTVGVAGGGGSGQNLPGPLGQNLGLFQGADFRNAYLGNPAPSPLMGLTGAGVGGGEPQHVALFELSDHNLSQVVNLNDLSIYIGLTGGPQINMNLIHLEPGFGTPSSPGKEPNGQQEIMGDIEMVASMAPGATIDVYSSPNGSGSGTNNALMNYMANCPEMPPLLGGHGCGLPLANQLSTSWFTDADENTAQVIQEFAAQGQSFFVLTGDSGAYLNGVTALDIRFAASPWATMVGGTNLTMTGSGSTYQSESAWGGGGGGILDFTFTPLGGAGSVTFSQGLPPWQPCPVGSPSGCSTQFRNLPDVSAVSSQIVVCAGFSLGNSNFQCAGNGGTSFSTPLWAGFTALINQQAQINSVPPVGFLNPALYEIYQTAAYGAAFNDIADNSSNNGYNAVAGYDLATGLGTPKWGLIYDLVGGSMAPPPPDAGSDAGLSQAAINVSISAAMFEKDVCVAGAAGSGAIPGMKVTASYSGIPAFPNPINGNSFGIVQGDGSFSLADTEVGIVDSLNCTPTQLGELVNIVITETNPMTNTVVGGTTTTVPAWYWCPNHSWPPSTCP